MTNWDIFKEVIQVGFTPLALIGIFLYQWLVVKPLKEQTKTQSDLLQSIKTYFDIMNPEILKFRMETYEKIIEKEKKLEIHKIEEELKKEIGKSEKSIEDFKKIQKELAESLTTAFLNVYPNKRREVFNSIKPNSVRKAFEPGLLRMEKIDKKYIFPPIIPVSTLIKALENYQEKR